MRMALSYAPDAHPLHMLILIHRLPIHIPNLFCSFFLLQTRNGYFTINGFWVTNVRKSKRENI
jgi:hypothetical protein